MNRPQGENKQEIAEETLLPTGNWFPENWKAIQQLTTLPAYNQKDPKIAVFDFDNTCILGDIGQAVFRFQAFELRFRLTPESFSSLLPDVNSSLNGKSIDSITETLTNLYNALWDNIKREDFAAAKQQHEYALFTTLLLWFVEKARKNEQLGPRYVLPLLAKFLAGFTPNELDDLTKETISVIENEPLETAKVKTILPHPIGEISTSYEKGMRPYPEMQQLHQWLTKQEVKCHVVSASTDWLVQTAAKVFDFPVQPENIFGIRVRLENGVLTTEEQEGYPVTFREGKVEVIRQFFSNSPLLVAGDADTDYEMLTLPETSVRLIINRNQTGQIRSLYEDPKYLLQGIDAAKGEFRSSKESII